jgi:hypothetical protein
MYLEIMVSEAKLYALLCFFVTSRIVVQYECMLHRIQVISIHICSRCRNFFKINDMSRNNEESFRHNQFYHSLVSAESIEIKYPHCIFNVSKCLSH